MNTNAPFPPADSPRRRLASLAARMMAEDGISDYATAKRKAAHRLGLQENNSHLPEDREVEAELRSYHRIFQEDEQIGRIDYLRQKAVEIMAIMQRFNPYLSGSVLDGTAGRYAEIDIQLFTDSAKDVEIFLLNSKIDYQHSTPRSDRAEAVLTLDSDDATVNLIVYPLNDERVTFKKRNGQPRARARIDAVKKMLAADNNAP